MLRKTVWSGATVGAAMVMASLLMANPMVDPPAGVVPLNQSTPPQQATMAQHPEYLKYRQRILDISNRRDIKGLEEIAGEIDKKWENKKDEDYAALMSFVCGQIKTDTYFSDPLYFAEDTAQRVLEQTPRISEATEVELLLNLLGDIARQQGKVKGTAFEKYRSTRARLFLRGLQHIEQGIDPHWDINDRPITESAGELMQDPTVYRAYQRKLAESNRKLEVYGRQLRLRELEKWFLPEVNEYVIYSYKAKPYNLPELERYLNTYVADPKMKDRILKEVKRRMKISPEEAAAVKGTQASRSASSPLTPPPPPSTPPHPLAVPAQGQH